MSDRYVVLGSNSFSGSHFVARLLQDGHEVLGISRSPEVPVVYRAYGWAQSPATFEFVSINMNDVEAVAKKLKEFLPDVVVNFAAQSMVAQSWELPEHWYQTNVLSLVRLVTVLEQLPDLQKYVHVTTPEVYGSTEGWVSESRNFQPTTPYAVSRAAGDMHLSAMQETRGFPVCFTRAANVYGPGQQIYRVIPRALLYARLKRRLKLDGGGHSTRSFIHIKDVVDATYLIAERGVPGAAYHISTDEIISIRELVERACVLTGVSLSDLVVEGPERPGKDATYMLDSSRLKTEFGWAPKITLEQGMKDTLAWIDENLTELAAAPDSYVHKE